MARLRLRATPRAREDAVVGWQADGLLVKVRAAAERGKANEALCKLPAGQLGVASSGVTAG